MTRTEFSAWCKTVHLLDGATGSMLRRAGMPAGVCSETWILDHPQTLIALQRAYLAAGSEIIYAPTFGAIRSLCETPILCTLSVYSDGKCYFDGSAEEAAELLPGLGADAVGINCSSGPDQMGSVVRMMHRAAGDTPIAAKPNAGLPTITETGEAVYSMGPEDFVRHMQALKASGAVLLGGCCGTTPEFIAAMRSLK